MLVRWEDAVAVSCLLLQLEKNLGSQMSWRGKWEGLDDKITVSTDRPLLRGGDDAYFAPIASTYIMVINTPSYDL